MNLFKSVVVCVVFAVICGCDRSQPTPPVATNNTPVVEPSPVPPPSVEPSTPIPTPTPPVASSNPTPVELSDSTNSIGMEFNLIPAGKFTMGERDNAHEVTLTKPFKMGVHEVTQAQYEEVMGNNPSDFKGADNPVDQVKWHDAVEFCRRLSELPAEKAAGNVYRLPTEAQWEYACRAGTTTKYSFGDDESDLGDYAWYDDNSDETSHPVGGKQPNPWGLHDMQGNVAEWCQDWHASSGKFPADPRVFRGGGWYNRADDCRSANRRGLSALDYSHGVGFRVCLSPSGK